MARTANGRECHLAVVPGHGEPTLDLASVRDEAKRPPRLRHRKAERLGGRRVQRPHGGPLIWLARAVTEEWDPDVFDGSRLQPARVRVTFVNEDAFASTDGFLIHEADECGVGGVVEADAIVEDDGC